MIDAVLESPVLLILAGLFVVYCIAVLAKREWPGNSASRRRLGRDVD